MISESWGVMAELPIAGRRVYSVAEDTSSQINTSGLGDMTIMGMYTGLRPDRSIGLLAGVILPTGRFNVAGLERDTQLGTGATQIVLGGYYLGALNESNTLNYFLQGRYQAPVLTQDSYRPGAEAFLIAGLAYNLGSFGPVTRFAPVLQAIYQWRASDSGSNSDPANTGLQRAMIAPGIDVRAGQFRLFADVQIPVWQWVRGNQLVPEVLFRVQGSYQF